MAQNKTDQKCTWNLFIKLKYLQKQVETQKAHVWEIIRNKQEH